MEEHEVQLLGLIARGDRQAFEVLYRAYFPRLARFLDKMSRNAFLIEEIVNDTMLVVWQKAHTFNHSCKVSTWIFSIAYRQALKAINKSDDPIESDFELYHGAIRNEPEQVITRQQLQMAIHKALNELPMEQRVVVSLTYFHDMDYKEIAVTMDCPVNTVKTRMFHARQKLKNILSSHHEEIL
ncbi:sigma-70 family RNA polymerase sigma factor [Undibacterium sp. Jales W-56]|uniref:RNA polymerase sigma factor n=1 Tax=Undibacterium sp. Jales W-56 TaxID=2897325 RepID=UPI0021D1D527|nr:sigma-70 family RNA polymerase sigma factor [Undibacterium sp. Jales W-56]MCU6434028.1 sigma-70 family RNA polymerase sigma factor [Undibacterium sp. Jales W-56]